MLERPPTFEEIWRARIHAAACAVVSFLVLIYLQWRVLLANVYLGAGLAPLWNFAAFQAVSRILTGRTFAPRLDPRAKSTEEVMDLIFTVGFGFLLICGLYASYAAWEARPPAPV